jgi:hypothetical protein
MTIRCFDEEEDSMVVAANVVGTVSRPMLSKFMVSELLRAYKADKNTGKTLKILKKVDSRNQ